MSAPVASSDPRLLTHKLVKTYGRRRVVDSVDLELKPGEIVGLLGPNGAGKTTSFYIMVGLIGPTSGQVFLGGRNVTRAPMSRRAQMGLGYLPQEPSAFRKLSVSDNLLAIAEILPLSREQRRERVRDLLEELGLSLVAHQKAYTLSGGERRRLEIARALVVQPRFLLMDEPFSGVDPISVADVQQIILKLKAKGIGVLITDHNVRETLRIVDRAYLLHAGKVLYQGSSDDLIHDKDCRRFYLGHSFTL